jgi:taurine dioxygenase
MRIEPLTVNIGAEVGGVDLAAIDDAGFARVHAAFLEHKVLFFREQRLERASHVALGRRFGELMRPNLFPADASVPEIYVLASGGPTSRPTTDNWHVDSTYLAEPSKMGILRAIEVPPVGGDTLWANMEAVYAALPAALKARIAGRRSVNSIAKLAQFPGYGESAGPAESRFPPVEHPLVRTHPETGNKSLFVNQVSAIAVTGLDAAESDALLEELYALAANPEYQCRWRWRAGDVVMWDNRCTQHYAVCDYLPHARLMERVNVKGDRPF